MTQHVKEIRQAVQEFVNDEMNAQDGSVGIYPIGQIDEDLVKWIDEDVEGFTVSDWDKYSMTIECEGIHVQIALEDGYWTIVN